MGIHSIRFGPMIQLLPEHVANQIAAGEVVQRPASVVKELVENSLDAGATRIGLAVVDSGRTSISFTDNGQGIAASQVQLAFARHATSKLREADDLYQLTTMGFRGEALASIAAVSRVECTTRTSDAALATHLVLEGGREVLCEERPGPVGTHLVVRNLFFNVPARRQFLKTDAVEWKAILDAFVGLALAHPHVAFTLEHNGREEFHLESENDRSRLLHVLGKKTNERVVPVAEKTDVVEINGFIFRPEHARKTRGDQHWFVNRRTVRSPYLHRAVQDAFDGLVPEGNHPAYVLHLTVDPARIDVNVHPAKTEIKFDDERAVYAVVRSAVKHALGQHQVAPALDFESMQAFQTPPLQPNAPRPLPPALDINPNFNPFAPVTGYRTAAHPERQWSWEEAADPDSYGPSGQPTHATFAPEQQPNGTSEWVTPWKDPYLMALSEEGLAVLHLPRVQQVLAYESLLRARGGESSASQQLLFPLELPLSPSDKNALDAQAPTLHALGFAWEWTADGLSLTGLPAVLPAEGAESALLDFLRTDTGDQPDPAQGALWQLAHHTRGAKPTQLRTEEQMLLVERWRQCHHRWHDPSGRTVALLLDAPTLDHQFN
jgi:DNA mismatch repair protein MutL